MSGAAEDNLELIRRGYAAWNRGDIVGVAAILDEDVEWRGHPRLPEPGPYFGREAVRGWLDDLRSAWQEIEVHLLALSDCDDAVVALVHITGRGRGSGLDVASGIDAHVWRVRSGRVVEMTWMQGDSVARRLGVPPAKVQSTVEETPETLTLLAEAGRE